MAIAEKTIQEAFQRMLATINRLESCPIVINDWDVINRLSADEKYAVIIETADDFVSRQDTITATNNFVEKITLIVVYREDKQAFDDFRDVRQDVIDLFNDPTENARTAGGLNGIDTLVIDAGTPILPIYDQYVNPEELATTQPSFVYQTLLIHTEEF